MCVQNKLRERIELCTGCLAMIILPLLYMIFFALLMVAGVKLFEWLEPVIIFCLKVLGIVIVGVIVIALLYWAWQLIGQSIKEIEGRPILTKMRNAIFTLVVVAAIIAGFSICCVTCVDSFDSGYEEYNPDADHLRPDRY